MFRTEIAISPSQESIQHQQRCVALGSCFASMVGRYLSENKFSISTNPLGILYNPPAVHYMIDLALNGKSPDPERICALHGRYVHYDFHSRISGETPEELLTKIDVRLALLREDLLTADWLILTYGTAVVHRLNGRAVANCHKQPSGIFEKTVESQSSLYAQVRGSLELLLSFRPDLRVILTVSPVRHVRETLPVNAFSKSILRVLAGEIASTFPAVSYFPSYEIMLDDLRDYRYYQPDMIHPSPVAEDYIWEKFTHTYLNESTRKLLEQWSQIRRNMAHRPFNPASDDHRKFLHRTLEMLNQVSAKLAVEEEISTIKRQLEHE